MHNIVDNIKVDQLLKPQTITDTELASDVVDMQGAENLAVAVMVGDIADVLSTSAKLDLKIEYSDDGVAFESCTDSDVANYETLTAGVFASIDDEAKEAARYLVEYVGSKRYVKVTATPTGLINGGEVAMVAMLANHSQRPVVNN